MNLLTHSSPPATFWCVAQGEGALAPGTRARAWLGHPWAGPGCLSPCICQPAWALSDWDVASLGTGVVCGGWGKKRQGQGH